MKLFLPQFWRKRGFLACSLWLFSTPIVIFSYVKYLLLSKKATPIKGVKIICVGNANIGGVGKTQICLSLLRLLQKYEPLNIKHNKICFISKGYKAAYRKNRKFKKRVFKLDYRHCPDMAKSLQTQHAKQYGDEPVMLANYATCYVASSRLRAILQAKKDGYRTIITDDGMQDYSFFKDVTILVKDAEYQFGNGFCMPAGNLREPAKLALKRADIVAIVDNRHTNGTSSCGSAKVDYANDDNPKGEASDRANDGESGKKGGGKMPEYHIANIVASLDNMGNLANTANIGHGSNQDIIRKPSKSDKYLAFCGIGMPEKFFHSLKMAGFNITTKVVFPDHHNYSIADIRQLWQKAKTHGAVRLITTQKDYVKLNFPGDKAINDAVNDERASSQLTQLNERLKLQQKDIFFLLHERKIPLQYGENFASFIGFFTKNYMLHQQLPKIYGNIEANLLPAFPVKGQDLIARGIEGKNIGINMAKLKANWRASGFLLSKDKLLEML